MSKKDLQQSPTFRRWQERRKVGQAAPSEQAGEIGYSCLCCKDTSLIPGDFVRLYLDEYYGLLHPDTGELLSSDGVQMSSVTEVPYQCNRCQSYMIEIMTDTGRKRVERWADNAVDRSISKDLCQWIHEQEVEKRRLAAIANEQTQAMLSEIHQETATRLAQLHDEQTPQTPALTRLAVALGVTPVDTTEPEPAAKVKVATVVEEAEF